MTPEQGLAVFDATAKRVLAQNHSAQGRDFIDALVAAGFDKRAMELTPDQTAADLTADSIQFSVRFKERCLIGQTGPASHGYHSVATSVLGTGTCLLGATRQIDW